MAPTVGKEGRRRLEGGAFGYADLLTRGQIKKKVFENCINGALHARSRSAYISVRVWQNLHFLCDDIALACLYS